jgi:pimeloyl-ACP methyl ester carboxylesterase
MPVAAGLYYFVHEADNFSRPPVILIHGAGGHHLTWPPQILRMHNQRIFAVDLPGHGKSDGIGHHTIDDYTVEIIEFIKALKLNTVVLAGHSMGSAIALTAAILFPKKVLGLCLLGSGTRLRVSHSILQSASDPSTFAATIHMVIDHSFSPQTNARLKELAAQRMEETRPSVLYGDFLACNAFNITDQLTQISAPTFILCGALDKMVPLKLSESLRDNIAGAQMDIMPDAGHMLMLEQPDQTADKLSTFLNTVPFLPGL